MPHAGGGHAEAKAATPAPAVQAGARWAEEQQLIGIEEIDDVTYLRLSRPDRGGGRAMLKRRHLASTLRLPYRGRSVDAKCRRLCDRRLHVKPSAGRSSDTSKCRRQVSTPCSTEAAEQSRPLRRLQVDAESTPSAKVGAYGTLTPSTVEAG